MGSTRELIRLYKGMKLTLLVSVPTASALFFYVCTGLMGISLLFGFVAFCAVAHETPAPKELNKVLKGKVFRDDQIIWYMIESKEDGNVRVM